MRYLPIQANAMQIIVSHIIIKIPDNHQAHRFEKYHVIKPSDSGFLHGKRNDLKAEGSCWFFVRLLSLFKPKSISKKIRVYENKFTPVPDVLDGF